MPFFKLTTFSNRSNLLFALNFLALHKKHIHKNKGANKDVFFIVIKEPHSLTFFLTDSEYIKQRQHVWKLVEEWEWSEKKMGFFVFLTQTISKSVFYRIVTLFKLLIVNMPMSVKALCRYLHSQISGSIILQLNLLCLTQLSCSHFKM